MKRHLPNALTVARLPMAVAVFVLVALFDAQRPTSTWTLDAAVAVFVAAIVTDIVDGWLARRWNAQSDVGRVADAFIDKVLICGTFVFLLGRNFTTAGAGPQASPTGIAPWMVALIFGRELLVTGIRGLSESRGRTFTATSFGKTKMSLQAATIITVLLLAAHSEAFPDWLVTARDVLIWTTVAFTALSALAYAGRTLDLLRHDRLAGPRSS